MCMNVLNPRCCPFISRSCLRDKDSYASNHQEVPSGETSKDVRKQDREGEEAKGG